MLTVQPAGVRSTHCPFPFGEVNAAPILPPLLSAFRLSALGRFEKLEKERRAIVRDGEATRCLGTRRVAARRKGIAQHNAFGEGQRAVQRAARDSAGRLMCGRDALVGLLCTPLAEREP